MDKEHSRLRTSASDVEGIFFACCRSGFVDPAGFVVYELGGRIGVVVGFEILDHEEWYNARNLHVSDLGVEV